MSDKDELVIGSMIFVFAVGLVIVFASATLDHVYAEREAEQRCVAAGYDTYVLEEDGPRCKMYTIEERIARGNVSWEQMGFSRTQ